MKPLTSEINCDLECPYSSRLAYFELLKNCSFLLFDHIPTKVYAVFLNIFSTK